MGPCLVVLTACVTSRLGPGVLRQDWNERRRDDPMQDPVQTYPDDRWRDEQPARIPGPGEAPPTGEDANGDAADDGDSPAADLAERSVATALATLAGQRGRMLPTLAGWLPILEASGTFEEDPTTRKLHRQGRERARRRRDGKRVRRVEPAPPSVDH